MLYEYECPTGHIFDAILPVSRYDEPRSCPSCGKIAKKILTRAPYGVVQKDCIYDSPIDGRPITSWAARKDDLARNNCQEYDPEMKKDYHRRIERQQAELERSLESSVEAAVEAMPVRKREKLQEELAGGADVVPERQAAPFKSITKVQHGH